MAEFIPITTQEELNEVIADRINRAKDATRKEFEGWLSPDDVRAQTDKLTNDNASLNATIQTQLADIEALKNEAKENETKLAKYATDAVKNRIANELGLSFDSLAFISGGNEDEIRASAEALKKLVGTQTPPRFNPNEGDKANPYKTLLSGLND